MPEQADPNKTSPQAETAASSPQLPQAEVQAARQRRPSAIWLLPIVAVLVGLSLVLHNWFNTGPLISIRFKSAEGLAVGKTQLKYKEVVIGMVENIELGPQGEYVLVKARLNKSASYLANQESRFWVVRPRFGLGGVTGLGTLLSGAYIDVDAGRSPNPARSEFVGLELPPAVTNDRQGKRFVIYAATLGSLDIGSPVYYRKVQVGRLASYQLQKDGQRVALEVFVDAPHDRLVTQNTRFWNASGVDLSLNAEGLKLNTESLTTLLAGGLAFDRIEGAGSSEVAQADSVFQLYATQGAANDVVAGPTYPIRMEFEQSVRGLTVGAPIEFQGIQLGNVTHVGLRYEPRQHRFISVVDGEVQPQRLDLERYNSHVAELQALVASPGQDGRAQRELALPPVPSGPAPAFLSRMVEFGLRAQLKTANVLTGQMYVSLVFLPKATKAKLDLSSTPLLLPTAPGDFDQLQGRISSIISSLEQVPFADIGRELHAALAHVNALAADISTQLTPQARKTLEEAQRTLQTAESAMQGLSSAASEQAPLLQNTNQTLQEISRAARSLRVLSDYLQSNPEALLRGRQETAREPQAGPALPLPQDDTAPPALDGRAQP
jgi:paraquat-inducible protein B